MTLTSLLPGGRRSPSSALLLLVLLAAGCRKKDTLATLERVRLPAPASPAATLAIDSLGRAWVGDSARLVALDSAGHVLARVPVELKGAPRLLWLDSGRVVLRVPGAAAILDAAGKTAALRRSGAPLVQDPRRRWVFTASSTGSVLGLDPRSLAPRWGWPDAGSPVSALAVSPWGDRVYVALSGSGHNDVPSSIEVRDALSGRLLSVYRTSAPARRLETAPDGTLYALIGGDVVALRHGRAGLRPLWRHGFGGIGQADADELRVSPSGERIAVLARGKALRLLAARDGKVLQEGKQSPRDVAWDAAGRLWVLGEREIRIVR
jgi:hypothetical protein